jgi:hypothetical protein
MVESEYPDSVACLLVQGRCASRGPAPHQVLIRRRRKMKLRTLFLALNVSLAAFPALAADLSAPYSPSRAEWLQVTLYDRITQTTDLWQRRVGVAVVVFPQEQQVSVVISNADGQPAPTEQERAFHVRHVEKLVKGLLSDHEWAKDLKVAVNFQ